MITKEAQCKIITDYLNASGIVNQFLNDTIMDALDEIEAENTKPITNPETEATLRNKFTKEIRDFLSLLGGDFSFKQKSIGEFAVIDLDDETPFTLKIDAQNHIYIDNYYVFYNDKDCTETLKKICERNIKYKPSIAEIYKRHKDYILEFEEKWYAKENNKEQEVDEYDY